MLDVTCRGRAPLGDLTLAYDTAGDHGAPVLLIMGYTVPGRAWVHQIPALAAHHRVAWFDHRGCGGTRAAPGPYRIELLADDALSLLDHLGWARAHLVGVSMGGMVAQHIALAARDRVRSLTLIATHAGGFLARAPKAEGVGWFLRANLARRLPDRVRAVERLLFPADFLETCDRAWLRKVLEADFGTPIPTRYRLSQLAAVVRHDTRRRLGELAGLPTLVVKAGRDLLVRPGESDRLHRLIPGSTLLTFPDAGHGIVRQRADRLNPALLAHFAAADGQPLAATITDRGTGGAVLIGDGRASPPA